MWLESNFTEDDNFNIQVYFNKFSDQDSTEKKVFDLVFIENLLETTEIKYSLMDGKRIKPNETKFPMVFHPMPTSKNSDVRHISVSQMQFEASFAHSQLAFWIENEISEKNRVYSVEKVLKLRKNIK
ncbi:hypothetical protein JQK62_23850, partial [Leptospira santarosai]|nr:hypothetical protein [Leptospira santarosai]